MEDGVIRNERSNRGRVKGKKNIRGNSKVQLKTQLNEYEKYKPHVTALPPMMVSNERPGDKFRLAKKMNITRRDITD